MEIEIKLATPEDIDALIEVQNQGFLEDYTKYGECPGYNRTHESMLGSINKGITFKIIADNKIVGDIIVYKKSDNHYFLGCLCIIPEYENKKIGQKAMSFLDTYFTDAKHWSLETPADKDRNLYFYKKHGFEITKKYLDGSVEIVLFEKDLN